MTKRNVKSRLTRGIIAALLAVMLTGSALAVLASAEALEIAVAPVYLAALLSAALCAAGTPGGRARLGAAALAAAVIAAYALTHRSGLEAMRALLFAARDEAGEAAREALGNQTLLECGAFIGAALFFTLLNGPDYASIALWVWLALVVSIHAAAPEASLLAALPGLLAAACVFALTGDLQRETAIWRALIPAAVAVALAFALLPGGGTTWQPLAEAAERVRGIFEQYFQFTHERYAFSINEQGYDHAGRMNDSVVSMLGGPAEPHTTPVMAVDADADVLLRGAIRTAYTGWSWVDAEAKSRYLYYDLTHAGIRDRVFGTGLTEANGAVKQAQVAVKMLDSGTSTLFVPGAMRDFRMDLSTAVYYNTAGEVFLSRSVQPGDAYTLTALTPAQGPALSAAVARGEQAGDERYADVLARHSQLPEGIEAGVYALTMEVVRDANTAWDRAVAIRDYLRGNMRYTLHTAYPPQERDFVSYFLLDSREGYCSYYATAMAVMGRIAGLPTRYVEGYMARAGERVLTGEDAHAWAEVYFKGIGWIPFDATGGASGSGGGAPEGAGLNGSDGSPEGDSGLTDPTGESDDRQRQPNEDQNEDAPEGDSSSGGGPQTDDRPEDAGVPDGGEPESEDAGMGGDEEGFGADGARMPWLLILFALLVMAVGGWLVRKRLLASDPERLCAEAKSAKRALMIAYRANLTALGHMGLTPGSGETPEAFAARVDEAVKAPDFVSFTRAVTGCVYGRRPVSREDVKLGLNAYARFKAALGRRERARFTLTRIRRGLGDFERIP